MSNRLLITIEHGGKRYCGTYYLSGGQLVVEAVGLGRETVDASILNSQLGLPAKKLAKILLTGLVKEKFGNTWPMSNMSLEGSTTQIQI